MFVLWELRPHAPVDAVAGVGDVGGWRSCWGGVEGREDELGGLEVGEVVEEGLAPGGGFRGRGHAAGWGEGAEKGFEARGGVCGRECQDEMLEI